MLTCVSIELLDFSIGIRRLLDSDTDRRYAGMVGFDFDFTIASNGCCFTVDVDDVTTTFDFGCLIVEMRSGTCARADADLVNLTVNQNQKQNINVVR